MTSSVRRNWIARMALAAALSLATSTSAQTLDPLVAKAERTRADIFDVAQWGLSVPYDWRCRSSRARS
jgi:hypothetical protein